MNIAQNITPMLVSSSHWCSRPLFQFQVKNHLENTKIPQNLKFNFKKRPSFNTNKNEKSYKHLVPISMLPGIPLKVSSSSPPSAVVVNCGVVWRKKPPKLELHLLRGTCWQRRLKGKKSNNPIGSMNGVFTYIWLIFICKLVGKYTFRPMDPMGMVFPIWPFEGA